MEAPSGDNEQAQTPGSDIVLTPEMLAALGVPAEQVTPESVQRAITALKEHAATADQLAAKLAEVSDKLGTLEADAQARLAAELDKELADYDLDEETLGVVKTLSPEQRKPLLGKLPKKAAPAPEAKAEAEEFPKAELPKAEVPPPKPVHDPKAEQPMTVEQRVQAAEALIRKVQKEGKFQDYTAAREEVRRRQPELFS
jgi:hypothetical protein